MKSKLYPGNVNVVRENFPGLDGRSEFTRITVSSGVSNHTLYNLDELTAAEGTSGEYKNSRKHMLQCELFSTLDIDHGWGVCYGILMDLVWADRTKLSEKQVEQIFEGLEPVEADLLRERLNDIRDSGRSGWATVQEFLLTGVWVDLFKEQFSQEWYAAQAMAAHLVAENDFAFGYLICELEKKLKHEADALRGAKTLNSAREGGAKRVAALRGNTRKVVSEMERLVSRNGKSVRSAAEIIYRRGIGKSPAANRQAWYRRTKKR